MTFLMTPFLALEGYASIMHRIVVAIETSAEGR